MTCRPAIHSSTSSAPRQRGGQIPGAVLGDEHVVLDPDADAA